MLKKGRGSRRAQRPGPAPAPAPPQPAAAADPEEPVGPPPTPVTAAPVPAPAPTRSEAAASPEAPVEAADPVEVEASTEASTEAPTEAPTEEAAPPTVDPEPDEPVGPVLETAKLPDAPEGPAPPMVLPRVVAIANQKGGVGKTTTTVNLGAALAELGFRVLIVDLDPQGNASSGLGIISRDVERSVYDVLLADVPLEDVVESTSLKNLFVAPATIDLAGAEIELVPAMSREMRLRRAIDAVRPDYDLVIIDCPPSLGLLTVNGLAAADDVIVPVQCEYYALEGVAALWRNIGLIQTNLNPGLDLRGIVLTMYDARTKLADRVIAEVRDYFGEKVYETVIPRTVRLSEAPSHGQSIITFDSTSRGAQAYRDLAKEVSRGATRQPG